MLFVCESVFIKNMWLPNPGVFL